MPVDSLAFPLGCGFSKALNFIGFQPSACKADSSSNWRASHFRFKYQLLIGTISVCLYERQIGIHSPQPDLWPSYPDTITHCLYLSVVWHTCENTILLEKTCICFPWHFANSCLVRIKSICESLPHSKLFKSLLVTLQGLETYGCLLTGLCYTLKLPYIFQPQNKKSKRLPTLNGAF